MTFTLAVPTMSVEYLSVGKTFETNEDMAFVSFWHLTVIDGASGKLPKPVLFDGMSGGRFVAQCAREAIYKRTADQLAGVELIRELTQAVAQGIAWVGMDELIAQAPEARPSASIAVATILKNEVVLTQVGDVSFRVNRGKLHTNPRDIDRHHAELRRKAYLEHRRKFPRADHEEALKYARKQIEESLLDQVRRYQNKTTAPFGHGVLDGTPVPGEFIRVTSFPRDEVKVLEIASDGYFKAPGHSVIDAWEASWREVERQDPYKIDLYPSTKGSTATQTTDDRTILIAHFE